MSAGRDDQHRSQVRFVLDGEVVEPCDVDPSTTVLQYLRETLRRTGTKEGCAEGDCGACTVVVAEVDESGERLNARAVNSCIQFLPTMDGKELLTVESLGNEELHPAQQAMIDHHGSQCGFCTPGFIMSLFALYKHVDRPSRKEIDDALAGNLCRCTGYQPIINAAVAMYDNTPSDGDWTSVPAGDAAGADEAARISVLSQLSSNQTLKVECGGKLFYAPQSLDEFAEIYLAHPTATILAGGTDIGLWVTKKFQQLDVVLYVGKVRELCSLKLADDVIDIGAAVNLTDAMPLIIGQYPLLEELFLRFASPPIRNAGTLGGNIANGSPIGDSMPALMALDTKLLLRRGNETRTLPLDAFYSGYQETVLQPGEFISRILIPAASGNEFVTSYKVSKRFDQDISAICGAYRIRLDGETVSDIRIAYGGMAEVPKRALRSEKAIIGREWNDATVTAGMAALDEDFTPIGDMRASADYRQQVCKNLLQRLLLDSTGNEVERIYAYGR
jgi:xanthine dehydrogenase small subunit